MANRGKAIDIILVDVGPHMHPHLADVAAVLFNFALAKTLNKPSHEMAILLYGSEDTKNALYEELQEYEHVSVLQELRTPNQETLKLLQQLPAGSGPADVVDALTVALDLAVKASEARTLHAVPKRLTVISNFAEPGKEVDDEFMEQLTTGFKNLHMQLQLVCMPTADDSSRCTQEEALEVLRTLRVEAGDRDVRFIREPSDLARVFRLHEVSFQCVKAELDIGSAMKLRLRVYKKCGFEKLPNLKTKAVNGDGFANIITSAASFLVAPAAEDEQAPEPGTTDAMAAAEPVPFEEQVKAYRYGKQYVPIEEVDEVFYMPGKCLQLLGFVDRRSLLNDQRYLFLGDPSDELAQKACSGLVQAMLKSDKAAVVRYGRTARAQVRLYALLPQMGSATVPDHFVMVGLPFSEDMRLYSFAPMVPKPEMQPSVAQTQAALALVKAMDLAAGVSPPGVPELLKPEDTPNPVLPRFYRALGKLSLDPQQDVTGKEEELAGLANDDKLVQAVLQAPWQHFPDDAKASEATFKQAFTTQVVERTSKKQRDTQAAGANEAGDEGADRGEAGSVSLSDEYPVEDFQAAVEQGKLEGAVVALGRRVNDLVDKSVRNRAYAKALSCCQAMRQACVAKADAAPFNTFLREIKDKYRNHDAHAEFWAFVCENAVTLISSADVASSSVKPDEAQAFIAQQQEDAGQARAPEAEVVVLDDLDDME